MGDGVAGVPTAACYGLARPELGEELPGGRVK